MQQDGELDRIFLREDDIVPSSGFVRSVMDAVQQEAAAPPPIPFPWKRALPGFVLAVLIIGLILVETFRLGWTQATSPAKWVTMVGKPINSTVTVSAGWIALALILTYVAVRLSMQVGARRG